MQAKGEYLRRDDRFIIFLSFSLVLGLVVAVGVYFLWRAQELSAGGVLSKAALVVCPPFVLLLATGATPDSGLMFVLVVGTMVFANAFLYAGVAAGLYALFTVLAKRK